MGVKVCKKCNFTNRNANLADTSEDCPRCGAIYAKVDAHIQKAKELDEVEESRMIRLANRAYNAFTIAMVLMWVSIFTLERFIVNQSMVQLFENCSYICIALWIGYSFYSLLLKNTSFYYCCRLRLPFPIPGSIVMFFAIIFSIYVGFILGLPKMLHIFLSKKNESMLVTPVERYFNTEGCRHGVYVEEIPRSWRFVFAHDAVCLAKKEHVDMLQYGDKIELLGKKSAFGFDWQRYRIMKSAKNDQSTVQPDSE